MKIGSEGLETKIEYARRTKTMGDLDPTKWQTLCCPESGNRLKTVFAGSE